MFKVAYLIMCHKNKNQVNRLVEKLKSEHSVCFVHVDTKANFKTSEIVGVKTKKSYHGTLGSYSLVEISNELLKSAKEYETIHNIHFSYYCLLSGQDYPIQSIETINKQLEKHYPKPYIDCTPCSPGNWIWNGAKECAWYMKIIRSINRMIPNYSIVRKTVKVPFWICNRLARPFMNVKKDLSKNGVMLYGGSAWWVLPDDMVEYILNVAKEINKGNKFCPLIDIAVPEENYYQTILMNSKFGNELTVNPPEMVEQNCKTYANFSPPGKPFIGHPYIFTIEDKEMLKGLSKEKFFARKFDEEIDSTILDWIDENLIEL